MRLQPYKGAVATLIAALFIIIASCVGTVSTADAASEPSVEIESTVESIPIITGPATEAESLEGKAEIIIITEPETGPETTIEVDPGMTETEPEKPEEFTAEDYDFMIHQLTARTDPNSEMGARILRILNASAVEPRTLEDLYYGIHVLTGEVHTYPLEEQIHVLSVVMNRALDPDFPDTIRGVIEDRRWGIQYACFYDGNFFRTPMPSNVEAAIFCLQNGSQIPANVIYQSGAKQGSGVYIKLGHHYFCYK